MALFVTPADSGKGVVLASARIQVAVLGGAFLVGLATIRVGLTSMGIRIAAFPCGAVGVCIALQVKCKAFVDVAEESPGAFGAAVGNRIATQVSVAIGIPGAGLRGHRAGYWLAFAGFRIAALARVTFHPFANALTHPVGANEDDAAVLVEQAFGFLALMGNLVAVEGFRTVLGGLAIPRRTADALQALLPLQAVFDRGTDFGAVAAVGPAVVARVPAGIRGFPATGSQERKPQAKKHNPAYTSLHIHLSILHQS
jgi:hypothetical protein